MHVVGETGSTEVAELLIRYGALPDLRNEVCTKSSAILILIGEHKIFGQMYPSEYFYQPI